LFALGAIAPWASNLGSFCSLMDIIYESMKIIVLLRHCLSTDMKDKELKYWTGNPPSISGYLVAELEGIVVGTISYKKVNNDSVEIFRLSVDQRFRKLGIARKLVQTVKEIGAKNGYTFMMAVTNSAPPADAISYYRKNGWTETERVRYSWLTYAIYGVKLVHFKKYIL